MVQDVKPGGVFMINCQWSDEELAHHLNAEDVYKRQVSNRESGEGRYDIAIYPYDKTKDAYILEFKVLN